MSRGRKQENIKRITKRDAETMKCISHTGLITRFNAKNYFNVSERRLKLLEKNNYIIEHNIYTRKGIQTTYTLGTNGYKYITQNTTIEHTYKSNLHQIEHDIKLSQMYCQVTQEERKHWLNENQIIHSWKKMSDGTERIACLDAVITMGDETIGIEVITNNYGQEEMIQKEAAARALNIDRVVYINAK